MKILIPLAFIICLLPLGTVYATSQGSTPTVNNANIPMPAGPFQLKWPPSDTEFDTNLSSQLPQGTAAPSFGGIHTGPQVHANPYPMSGQRYFQPRPFNGALNRPTFNRPPYGAPRMGIPAAPWMPVQPRSLPPVPGQFYRAPGPSLLPPMPPVAITPPPLPPLPMVAACTMDDQFSQQLLDKETEILELKDKISLLNAQQLSEKASSSLHSASMAALTTERDQLLVKINELKKNHSDMMSNKAKSDSTLSEADTTIKQLSQQVSDLKNRLSQQMTVTTNKQAFSDSALSKADKAILQMGQQNSRLKNQTAGLQDQISGLTTKLQVYEQSQSSLRATNTKLKADLQKALADQKTSQGRVSGLAKKLDVYENSQSSLRNTNTKLKADLQKALADQKASQGQVSGLAKKLDVYENSQSSLRNANTKLKNDLQKALADQKTSQDNITARDGVMTELKNKHAELQQVVQSLTEKLRKAEAQNASDASNADAMVNELNAKIQTLQVTEASLSQKDETMSGLNTTIEQLTARLDTANARYMADMKSADTSVAELNNKIQNQQATLSEQTTLAQACQTQSQNLTTTIASLEQKISDLENMSKDDDNDGVMNASDKCPASEQGSLVDSRGCEPDSDLDGLADRLDLCPQSPESSRVDKLGCASSEVITIEGLNFKSGSSEFTDESVGILDRVVDILTRFPGLNLEVAGHTDNIGSADLNRSLSGNRALAVKDYLVEHDIDSSRLSAAGYGSDQPIADNASSEGRALNRRVELRRVVSR